MTVASPRPLYCLWSSGDVLYFSLVLADLHAVVGSQIATEALPILERQRQPTLRGLEHKLPEGVDKDFLKEAIDCFEAGANRATIVMVWILALDHLFAHVLVHKLAEFNAALEKNTDKRVRVTAVTQRDDFSEMKESKFIELCRTAKIISNDVRKILDQKLETRNSCAHPSGVIIRKTKVIDFVEDLIENVVMKYPT
jgi:hypothetical protein